MPERQHPVNTPCGVLERFVRDRGPGHHSLAIDENTGWAPGVVPMASGIFHSGVSNGFGDVFFSLPSVPAEHRDRREECYGTRQRLWKQDRR